MSSDKPDNLPSYTEDMVQSIKPPRITNIVATLHFQPDPSLPVPPELERILNDDLEFFQNGMKVERDGTIRDCIPLHYFAMNVKNVEYSPKHGRNKGFSGAIFRYTKRKHTYLVFSSGKVVINGGLKQMNQIPGAVNIIKKILSKLPATRHLQLLTSQVTNIVATSTVPTKIAIHKLSTLVQSLSTIREIITVSYDPDVFSGARVHFRSLDGVPTSKSRGRPYAAVFSNGTFFLTGNKSVEQLYKSHSVLVGILVTFRDLHV